MGNIVLVNQVVEANNVNDDVLKKFNLESLISTNYVKAVFNSCGQNEPGSLKEIFEDFEKQTNQDSEDNFKKNFIKELNELHTAGLSTPDFFTQDLKETRFEKYFRVVETGTKEGEEYYKLQYMKFLVSYLYIKPFYTEGENSEEGFYSKLAQKLENTDDGGLSVYSFEMGLSMTFTILDELRSIAPAILEKAMKSIYNVLTQIKTGLFKTDDYKFYAREEILTRHREYLVQIYNDKDTPLSVKDLSVRLIILIGNLRSSGEDYLVAYNIIKENGLKMNLDSELSLNTYLQEALSNNQAHEQSMFKVNEKNSSEVTILTGMDYDIVKSNATHFAFDKE